MKPVLLMDIGSTYTKVTAVDVDAPAVLGTASAFTTATTDIGEGLGVAMDALQTQTGPLAFAGRYACSSAAGGLRMIACGLVPSLTVEAARRAALGAGAKVIQVYSYALTDADIREIGALTPDILLLTGGTDGGDRKTIEQNAAMLAGAAGDFPVVIAGNRNAADACEAAFSESGHAATITENVMPVFGRLNVEPVQRIIRDLFLQRIVHAKGLSREQSLLDGIVMPTPAAVLDALRLLSSGLPGRKGLGDLVAVDLGGATTDVYSIADGLPQGASTILRGLTEPHAKRTVEGDIGMRYSAQGVLDAAGADCLGALSGLAKEALAAQLAHLLDAPDALPREDTGDTLGRLDFALACAAVNIALTRHAGTLEQVFTPTGVVYQQTGKDLTGVDTMILTGGALVRRRDAAQIAAYARTNQDAPMSLKPRGARALIDGRYILAAMGLLAGPYPDAALTLLLSAFPAGQEATWN